MSDLPVRCLRISRDSDHDGFPWTQVAVECDCGPVVIGASHHFPIGLVPGRGVGEVGRNDEGVGLRMGSSEGDYPAVGGKDLDRTAVEGRTRSPQLQQSAV